MTNRVGPFLLASFAGLLCAVPLLASAQVGFLPQTADLSLRISPELPVPNSTARFSVESTLLDLDASYVSWRVNGSVLTEGIGISTANVPIGDLGSETKVRVDVIGQGASASTEATIRPTRVDLLWEADSYVPPFYKGRAEASAGSNVRLFAVPQFVRSGTSAVIPPNELLYTWRKGGKILQEMSGRGRSTAYVLSPTILGTETFSVEVRTIDGTLRGTASVRVPASEPIITLYENHPVFGVLYHRALVHSAEVSETETTFTAVPYFATVSKPNEGSLTYAWTVNGNPVRASATDPDTLTINAEGTRGIARIELALTHASSFLVNMRNAWTVTLSGNSSANTVSPFTDPFVSPE